jgi:hypothetical protein
MMHSLSIRLWRVLVAFGLVTAGLILSLDARARVSPASAAVCRVARTANAGLIQPSLSGVSVTSSRNAWAVGSHTDRHGRTRTLIERWNGKAWQVQPSPNPGASYDELDSVAATSATNAWAVGAEDNGGTLNPALIERWNGKVWKVQPSPNPSPHQPGYIRNKFLGVAATSSTNAWAVGYYLDNTAHNRTLIEHWNGKAWQIQPSPNPGASYDELYSVAATSATNAWAVGFELGTPGKRTLIEHWNGTAWKVQRSPTPPTVLGLSGVTATSSTNAWAVGNALRTVIEHWNGKAWTVQPSPKLGGSWLSGVAATSSTNAWVVGNHADLSGTVIERWNGKAWKVQASPNPRGFDVNVLSGVATTSTKVWAVGYSSYVLDRGLAPDRTLALHCG